MDVVLCSPQVHGRGQFASFLLVLQLLHALCWEVTGPCHLHRLLPGFRLHRANTRPGRLLSCFPHTLTLSPEAFHTSRKKIFFYSHLCCAAVEKCYFLVIGNYLFGLINTDFMGSLELKLVLLLMGMNGESVDIRRWKDRVCSADFNRMNKVRVRQTVQV